MSRLKYLLVLALVISGIARADTTAIGFVKTVSGDASIVSAGKTLRAQVGTPVRTGDVLRTGAKGSLGITFKDNTVMSFGPDTELTVDEYLYSPGKGDLKMQTSMTKGTLQVVSGVIAKLRPDAVTVKTPTGLIGVRGTQFLVKVEP
jgi:hypothetical protein